MAEFVIQRPLAPLRIELKMSEGAVARAPRVLSAQGLGSCVAVAFYDAERGIGGLAHVMLPSCAGLNGRHSPYQCADTAIATLVEEMRNEGAALQDIVAKLAGGAQTFASYDGPSGGIGSQNITSIKEILRAQHIPLLGEDVEGSHGRSVEFHLQSGTLVVREFGKEPKEL